MIVMSPLDNGQREQALPRWVGLVRVQAGGLEADFDNALASARCNVVAFAAAAQGRVTHFARPRRGFRPRWRRHSVRCVNLKVSSGGLAAGAWDWSGQSKEDTQSSPLPWT